MSSKSIFKFHYACAHRLARLTCSHWLCCGYSVYSVECLRLVRLIIKLFEERVGAQTRDYCTNH